PKYIKRLSSMLKDLSDDHFFALIFTSEDRLGTDVKGSNLLLTHVVFPLDKMILA
ncbi:MAG: hypothetical protein H6Q43_2814, partial [Deltaproteobacteria bacterium]|nr:hypothetical protein [Deltaproteobacteria bacterium]